MKQKLLLIFACLLSAVSAWADQVDNTIYYTSEDGSVVWPKGCSEAGDGFSLFGANIVLNTYEDGHGKIVFDNNVTSIEKNAYEGKTKLVSITIPSSVRTIGEYAFAHCSNLSSPIIIPEGVTIIDRCAFGYCEKIPSITIPYTVSVIDEYAFINCSGLNELTIPEGVRTIKTVAFSGCSNIMTLNLPSTLGFIGEGAFWSCASLTSLVIPNSVTTIKDNAFQNCTGLTSVEISNQLTEIPVNMFAGCTKLTSVNIPNSVTIIRGLSFKGCTSLTTVNLPTNLTTIGNSSFYGCTSLSSVVIPNTVESIEAYAFFGCSNLSSVNIPTSVYSISNYTFQGCTSLTSIEIPTNVSSIGTMAFYECSSLSSITCRRSTPPTCGTDAFKEVKTSECTLYVPGTAKVTYAEKDPWSAFTNISALDDLPIVYYEGNSTPKTAASVAEANSTVPNTLYFSEAEYNESTAVANVAYRKPDGSWYAKEITLQDAYPFYCPLDVQVGTVKYTRNLSYDVWNPICLPFSLYYDEWKDKVSFAELSGVHMYDDGARTTIEFVTVKSGDLIPNIPYVIKPINTGVITLEANNKTLKASPAEHSTFVSSGSSRWTYKIYSNFQTVSKDYLDAHGDKVFGLNSGNLVFGAPVNDLSPFRIYLEKVKSENGYWPETRSVVEEVIYVMVDGKLVRVNDATEIIGISADTEVGAIFNLQGMKVGADYKGIMIINGKKVIKK